MNRNAVKDMIEAVNDLRAREIDRYERLKRVNDLIGLDREDMKEKERILEVINQLGVELANLEAYL